MQTLWQDKWLQQPLYQVPKATKAREVEEFVETEWFEELEKLLAELRAKHGDSGESADDPKKGTGKS